MSYVDLQNAFSTLHNEAKEAFKHLASNKKIFSHLEKKISDSEKELETLKKSMIEDTKERTRVLDSGCSRHVTGDSSLFFDFVAKKKGFVTYGDNNEGAILGKESVHVSFDESYPKTVREGSIVDGAGVPSEGIIKDQEENRVDTHPKKAEEEPDLNSEKKEEDHFISNTDLPLEWKSSKDHPIDNII
ncbi:uncharacterized protein LOC127093932 [Lathyrus oleraceus]|uniref:uncharacterized protein LOC127093932 n=1 Tax=Pisum sativum TaxID=3888 RepID=UPI0021D1E22E|nr:uncharacterized protein LOC127093932 [Pisum sativum]